MKKVILFLCLLPMFCYGQTPVNWNSGSNSVMIAYPIGSGGGHNNVSFYSKVDTGKGDTTQRAGRTKPRYRKDAIGAHPLRNVQQSQPKVYNEATPKVLSLEEKLLLYAQECWEDSTLKSFHIPDNGTACNVYPEYPDNCLNPTHRNETKYIHREPTFMGFIEWLKKK